MSRTAHGLGKSLKSNRTCPLRDHRGKEVTCANLDASVSRRAGLKADPPMGLHEGGTALSERHNTHCNEQNFQNPESNKPVV